METKNMSHLNPTKYDKEHLGFIGFLLHSGHTTIKSIPLLMKENIMRKKKVYIKHEDIILKKLLGSHIKSL